MNPRERNLLIVLVAILAVGMGGYAGWNWFWVPLKGYNEKIRDLTEANESLETQMQIFAKERKKLDVARLKSLPTNQQQAYAEYETFLKKVLKDSQLNYDLISHTGAQDVRLVAPIKGVKKTRHHVMTV